MRKAGCTIFFYAACAAQASRTCVLLAVPRVRVRVRVSTRSGPSTLRVLGPHTQRQKKICKRAQRASTSTTSSASLSASAPPFQLSQYKVIAVNERCLCNKQNDFALFLATESPDVICVTETWLHADIPDSLLCCKGVTFMSEVKSEYRNL